MHIKFADTPETIAHCFPLMYQLRPHLTLDTFLAQVERMQQQSGYQLVYLDDSGIQALAGIRRAEWLYAGKYLEIDDLVTTENSRSMGYGGQLFDWIKNYAVEMGCAQVRLLSGVQRERAHQFYLNKGMKFEAKYFSLTL